MSDNESFFSGITEKLNDNISSVCVSLNNYKSEIKTELELFNNNINTKICELYDIIESKQNEINQLKITLEEKTFEESNFNRVSILKTQDKEIKDLKNQLDIQIRRNTLLEDKIKLMEKTNEPDNTNNDNVVIIEEKTHKRGRKKKEQTEIVVKKEEPHPSQENEIIEKEKEEEVNKETKDKPKKDKSKKDKAKKDKSKKEKKDKPKKDKAKKEKKEKVNNTESLTDAEEQEIKEVVDEIINDNIDLKSKNKNDLEEDNVSLDNIDVIEHDGVDYYVSEKNYIYEISNDEGDIGIRLGTYINEVVAFY